MDKSKDPIKDSEKERSDIVPSSQQDLVAPGSQDYIHGPETQAKLEKLREQFPNIFFERMMFVPALEPVPRNWDNEVVGHIRHVARQYEVMKKHAVNLL